MTEHVTDKEARQQAVFEVMDIEESLDAAERRITGSQARKLLEYPDNAAPWLIEMRNLAETVAWLYGHEGDGEIHAVDVKGGDDADIAFAVKGGMVVLDIDGGYRTPDEAVEFARALLTAAEKARAMKAR